MPLLLGLIFSASLRYPQADLGWSAAIMLIPVLSSASLRYPQADLGWSAARRVAWGYWH